MKKKELLNRIKELESDIDHYKERIEYLERNNWVTTTT
jgi:predicted nuclease with TOPRIM domain